MQERRYCEEDSYRPQDEDHSYAEFGELTEFGRRTRGPLASFSRDFGVR